MTTFLSLSAEVRCMIYDIYFMFFESYDPSDDTHFQTKGERRVHIAPLQLRGRSPPRKIWSIFSVSKAISQESKAYYLATSTFCFDDFGDLVDPILGLTRADIDQMQKLSVKADFAILLGRLPRFRPRALRFLEIMADLQALELSDRGEEFRHYVKQTPAVFTEYQIWQQMHDYPPSGFTCDVSNNWRVVVRDYYTISQSALEAKIELLELEEELEPELQRLIQQGIDP